MEAPKAKRPRKKQPKVLGAEPTKAQLKHFTRCIESKDFVDRLICVQNIGQSVLKILNEQDGRMFVSLDNTYFLYNTATKKLLCYGSMFDDKDPPRVNSSKDIPWSEV